MNAIKNSFAIAGREIRTFFTSPIAYVTLMIFLLLTGYFFWGGLIDFAKNFAKFERIAQIYRNPQIMQQLNLNSTVIASILFNMLFVFLFLIPLLTMRSFAEEKKNRTEELLMTSPVTINQIIAGKFLGTFTFMMIMVIPTLIYQVLLFKMVNAELGWIDFMLFRFDTPEVGPVITGYLGIFLFLIMATSIGLFTSSLTENQIIAAVISFVILLFLFIIRMIGGAEGTILRSIVDYLSVIDHIKNFIKGMVDIKDLFYFATITALFIFLTKRSVESIRWR